mmetsp:Transcript_46328/g.68365  ORF Transcript_46328/g.68365 Transcript_46328/m.68365 type:complete len:646 (-) Transcript_46328:238-2175(-)
MIASAANMRNSRLSYSLLIVGLLSFLLGWGRPTDSVMIPDDMSRNRIRETPSMCIQEFLKEHKKHPSAMLRMSSIQGTNTAHSCKEDGLSGGVYPCLNVDLNAYLTLSDLGGGWGEEGNDGWGWKDPQTKKEYALVGMEARTTFVDVTDRNDPVVIGWLKAHGGTRSNWRDIKTWKNYAFIVSEATGHGMQIFDLTELRSRDGGGSRVEFAETGHYSGVGKAHNVFINEDSGFAYIVGARNRCNGGLHMVDLSKDPLSPTFAGCFDSDGYTHDVQCVNYKGPDTKYRSSSPEREICFACNEDTLTIVDVTDKTNPKQVSRLTYDDKYYTHQGWLTENHEYFLFGDEMDEKRKNVNTRTYVVDVKNLDSPKVITTYESPTSAAIDHNQYILGMHVYQANYRAGLRILDASQLINGNTNVERLLKEVAYFDIYPEDNSNRFDGAWSVYPFFDGIVLIFGVESGLFVVSPKIYSSSPPSCVNDAECDDGNMCTNSTCDVSMGICRNSPINTGVVVSNGESDRKINELCQLPKDDLSSHPSEEPSSVPFMTSSPTKAPFMTSSPTKVPSKSPSKSPVSKTTQSCGDDANWTYIGRRGNARKCAWIKRKYWMRCKVVNLEGVHAQDACQDACDQTCRRNNNRKRRNDLLP